MCIEQIYNTREKGDYIIENHESTWKKKLVRCCCCGRYNRETKEFAEILLKAIGVFSGFSLFFFI